MLIELIHQDSDTQSSVSTGGAFQFADHLNRKLVHGLLVGPPLPTELRSELLLRHLASPSNQDIQYYFLREAASLLNNPSSSLSNEDKLTMPDNLLTLLEVYDIQLPNNPKSSSVFSSKKKAGSSVAAVLDHQSALSHQKAFQAAWQALLPWLKSQDHTKRVLSVFHRLVLPNLPKPNLFLDFLADCCDIGGTIALLALNGLFTLITKHNL